MQPVRLGNTEDYGRGRCVEFLLPVSLIEPFQIDHGPESFAENIYHSVVAKHITCT
jgi:hypothetical protein